MSAPLKEPPVYFVVAQVRFNPVLKLKDYVPAVQEALRRAGFPAFSTQRALVVQLTMQDGQPVPTQHAQERFKFGTTDRTHDLLLDAESITLQSTKHNRFEEFAAKLISALEIVHKEVGLDFTERVGVRYLDRVVPKSGETLQQYLDPHVLGLNFKLQTELEASPTHSYSESVCSIDGVLLRCRVVVQEGPISFPPDLQPLDLQVDERLKAGDGIHAIIDTDGSLGGRNSFSLDDVNKQLHKIHGVIHNSFEKTATSHAFKVWGRQ